MKVYVAMICDRHSDPEPELFSTAEAAIEYARNWAVENDRHGDFKEQEIQGWLYYARYSCESDAVWVLEKELAS